MGKDYRIEVVQEENEELRMKTAEFLSTHGFEMSAATAQEIERDRAHLESCGAKNWAMLNERLIVALAPDSNEIYGAVHLASPRSLIIWHFCDDQIDPAERNRRIDAALERINLSKLAVDSAHGGVGIGHALVENAVEVARGLGYDVICGQIDTELGNNTKLKKFYKSCGFTVAAPYRTPVEMTGGKNFHRTSQQKGSKFFLKL
ncbi:hypothetical protein CHU70_10830 (plasmid) [Corynebacterium sp. LK10]|uniref:GNAT family N-acetyltransferase n=1 Tax=Corynebacterium sp. LK10 TaxID=2022656 RepID=UPI0011CA03EA|nr:GNAT family N-acetyltransferase [Corynebacterium sp. LK10]TXS81755.1 hypothetical protein CHU70_10830 [Corynebacterium sp. LK10]